MSYMPGERESIPTGYEAIAVDGVKSITAALLTPATGVFTGKKAVGASITVETDSIRYTIDGTTPTNLIGHLVLSGDSFWISGNTALTNLQMIKVTGAASAKVTIFHAGSRLA